MPGTSSLPERATWGHRIERAIDQDLFEVHLQPLVGLSSGTVVGAEALLRLADADELVPPGQFVPIAEDLGLAPLVDTWMLRNALPVLTRCRALQPDFLLAVNMSAHSLESTDFEQAIIDALAAPDLDPSSVLLEITETATVSDMGCAQAFTERMSARGVRIALDDFGAGPDSFAYLTDFVFDYVKIDGDFVSNCLTSSVDRTIVRAIATMARDLGKKSVAEFVTTPEIARAVRADGVDLGQGYLFGCPAPVDEFIRRYLSTPSPYSHLVADLWEGRCDAG